METATYLKAQTGLVQGEEWMIKSSYNAGIDVRFDYIKKNNSYHVQDTTTNHDTCTCQCMYGRECCRACVVARAICTKPVSKLYYDHK